MTATSLGRLVAILDEADDQRITRRRPQRQLLHSAAASDLVARSDISDRGVLVMPPIMLSREQREAIRAQIVTYELREIACVYSALQSGEVEEAQTYRARYVGELRLLDDLGWEESDDRSDFPLTMDDAELIATLRWLNAITAETVRCQLGDDHSEIKGCVDACDAIGDVLAQLAERDRTTGDPMRGDTADRRQTVGLAFRRGV